MVKGHLTGCGLHGYSPASFLFNRSRGQSNIAGVFYMKLFCLVYI